ncbi:MAG: hypothetical protein ACI396_10880 [Acutalibacteraceae bacterium]
MDILRFIGSKDIREYLSSIGYVFSTPEAAYLVWLSRKATLYDKIATWEEIVDTMPDCEVDENRFYGTDFKTFHEFLKYYIALQKSLPERFYQNNGEFIYTFEYHYSAKRYSKDDCWQDAYCYFDDYESCLEKVKEDNENGECNRIIIKKYKLNNDSYKYPVSLTMNGNYDIMSVTECLSDEEDNADNVFEDMWFDIPTPFKRGDILCNANAIEPNRRPFVIDALDTWDFDKMVENGFNDEFARKKERRTRRLHTGGDYSDMSAVCYYIYDNSVVYDTLAIEENYLEFEYYTEPLKNENRALQPISAYLKEIVNEPGKNCPLALLLNSYKTIIQEEENKKSRQTLLGYTEKARKDYGCL